MKVARMRIDAESAVVFHSPQSQCARGFSLLELLLVVNIICVLSCLLLPAIQAAVAQSRTTTCKSNLKEIGCAIAGFEATYGHLPSMRSFKSLRRDDSKKIPYPGLSVNAQLHPFLTGANSLEQLIEAFSRSGSSSEVLPRIPAPGLLHCPSDGEAEGTSVSYRFGIGTLINAEQNGPFCWQEGRRLSAITDGLASTAFASERIVVAPTAHSPFSLIQLSEDGPGAPLACLAANRNPASAIASKGCGQYWLEPGAIDSGYRHTFPPNSSYRDCTRLQEDNNLISARSQHSGGVNVLFGDGSARFYTNSVDLAVWRSVGQIDDGSVRSGGDQ
jgi:prepilin-type processing-associated H-X9-DG protein/prepilin-type N-terminal cleavage/methylation domain-containing protein